MKNNTVNYDFKKQRKSANRQKRLARIIAVICAFLMVSGIIGSIVCYLLAGRWQYENLCDYRWV